MSATIRTEQPGDEAAIHAVHADAFPSEDEAKLVDALRAGGGLVISLVALVESEIVGHVAFSKVSMPGAVGLGLAPVAVLAKHRRRGIAARLIHEGLDLCRERGVGFVVVLGAPSYYARFGFETASGRGLQDEYGGGEAFQVLELRPNAVPRAGGLVRYAPEFASFDQA